MGGAKKSFSTDKILLEKTNLTITELLQHLTEIKPSDTLEFDTNNLLVAINGVDSSVLDGYNTSLKDDDVVSIIPIIHGGKSDRIQFQISGANVEIFDIKYNNKFDSKFLDQIRAKHPSLMIQMIDSSFLLGVNHAKKILSISLNAQKNQILLSKKIETDILLRFAGTTQISYGIKTVGRKSKKDFAIIALGKKISLNKLHTELKPDINSRPLSRNNVSYIQKQFGISKKQISVISSKNPLEDILVERAAILF